MRVWLWRVASFAAAVLASVGIATSQAWVDPTANDPNGDLPSLPYIAPQVAGFLPSDDGMSQLLGASVLTISDGYPPAQTYLSSSALARDVRIFSGLNAWGRRWTSADAQTTAAVFLNGAKSADAVLAPQSLCGFGDPVASVLPDSAAVIERYTDTGDPYRYCELIRRPGFNASLRIDLPPGTTAEQYQTRGEAILSAIVAARGTTALTGGTALNQSGRVDTASARTATLRGWLLAFLFLAGLAVAPSLLRDRSMWLRLISRAMSTAPHPRQIDVAAVETAALARVRAFGWWRFALNIWAIRLSEELRLDALWSGVVIAAAFLGGLLIEQLASRRYGAHPGRSVYRFGGFVVVGIGALLTIGIIVAALGVWDLGSSYTIGAALVPGANEEVTVKFGVFLELLAGVILLSAYVPLAISRRLAARSRRASRVGPDAPTVLYLRSFIDDSVTLRTHFLGGRGLLDRLAMRRRERFEQLAAFELSRYGQVIAVGRPGELLPPELGALRLYFRDDEWHERVAELSESSEIIAMTLGRTEGFAWELERLRHNGLLHKTLILVPPVPIDERVQRLAILARTLDIPERILQTTWARHVVGVRFPLGDAAPIVYIARAPDDLAYASVVSIAMRDPVTNIAFDALPTAIRSESPEELDALLIPLEGGFRAEELTAEDSRALSVQRVVRRAVAGAVIGLMLVMSLFLVAGWALFPEVPAGTKVSQVRWAHGDIETVRSTAGNVPVAVVSYNGGYDVVALDPVTLQPNPKGIFHLTGSYSDIVIGDGIAYIAWPESGTVTAVDLSDGSTRWTATVRLGVRGLALAGSTLTAADPAGGAISIINTADGSAREVAIGGVPWDTAIDGKTAYAVTLKTSRLVTVDLASATVSADAPTLTRPVAVATWAGGIAVQSWVAHEVAVSAQLGVDSPELGTRLLEPSFTAAGGLLAVEGPERVSIVNAAGTIYRIQKGTSTPTAILVDDDGVTFYNASAATLVHVTVAP